jgi:hypothetical protein
MSGAAQSSGRVESGIRLQATRRSGSRPSSPFSVLDSVPKPDVPLGSRLRLSLAGTASQRHVELFRDEGVAGLNRATPTNFHWLSIYDCWWLSLFLVIRYS